MYLLHLIFKKTNNAVHANLLHSALAPIQHMSPVRHFPALQAETIVEIRNLVILEPASFHKWSQVVDDVVKMPHDARAIKEKIVSDGGYAEAVLRTLNIWNACGQNRPDLVRVLRDAGLANLAGR